MKLSRRFFLATASSCLLGSAVSAEPSDPRLKAILTGTQRDPANIARDGARHPFESLSFWGLTAGMKIVEIWPSPGYWTEVLAPYAKVTGGEYTAVMSAPSQSLPPKFGDTAVFGKIGYATFNRSTPIDLAPASADLILTARNIHDWMWTPGMAETAMAQFFKILKPGGILAVEDHRADPRPMVAEARDGYVATSFVVDLAQRAGFRLEASSEINANGKDSKDHPFGVWTLPPTRRSAPQGQPSAADFDHRKYDAIGESDRMTLRFRKPEAQSNRDQR